MLGRTRQAQRVGSKLRSQQRRDVGRAVEHADLLEGVGHVLVAAHHGLGDGAEAVVAAAAVEELDDVAHGHARFGRLRARIGQEVAVDPREQRVAGAAAGRSVAARRNASSSARGLA